MPAQNIFVRTKETNIPQILSSGRFEITLIGESDSEVTVQQLTPIKIGTGAVRGNVRVILTAESLQQDMSDDGKGVFELYTHGVDTNGFYVSAIHDLKNGTSRTIRVHWVAFGYEGSAPLTAAVSSEGLLVYNQIEHFTGSDLDASKTKLTLSAAPIADSTLMMYVDRVPAFFGADFAIDGAEITMDVAFGGDESITVTYTTHG